MEYNVSSISYDRRNFYAHKHEQVFEIPQAKTAKETFAQSRGKSLRLPKEEFSDLEIFVEGQLTVYRQKGELIGEYSYGADFLSVNRCECLINNYLESYKVIYIENAVSFLAPGSYNIHHFFFEVLPVIYANRRELRNRKVLVPSTIGGGKFFSEFNHLLNLGINFIEVPIKSIVRGKNITVYGTFPFRIYPLQKIQELRSEILEKFENSERFSSESLVYIGRGDTERNRRRITNEQQVFEILDRAGKPYTVVRPGLLTLNETIQKIMKAHTVIGPTGGALFHQIWAQDLELVMELKPIRYESMSETEELSSFLEYSYIEVPTLADTNSFWSQANQEVDLVAFAKYLKES